MLIGRCYMGTSTFDSCNMSFYFGYIGLYTLMEKKIWKLSLSLVRSHYDV